MSTKRTAATPKKTKGAKGKKAQAELAKSDDIERVRIEKEVLVPASAEEVSELGLEHANVTLKIKAINDEIAEFSTSRRKKLRELRKDELRLANAVQSKTRLKRVKCFEVRDYKLNQVRFEDEHGTEIAPAEVMSPEMRQRQLFGEGDGASAKPVDVDEEEEETDDEE